MRKENRQLYFVNPLVDGACMGGISILVFLYYHFSQTGYSALQVSDTAIFLSGIFSWLVNYPHFSATTYRLYRSPSCTRQFPLTAFLIPPLLCLAVAACFLSPLKFAPFFVKLYVLWSPYHYSGQNYGLTLIYCRRAGIETTSLHRFVLATFLRACFIAQYARLETRSGIIPLFGVNYPMLGLPEWVATVALWGASGLGVFLLFLVLPSVRRAPHQIPWIVALPVAAQVLWTLIGDSNFSFQTLIPLFHGLQYLLVAWAVEMQEEPKKPANEKYFLFKRSALWTSANLMGGALLFYGLPRIFSSFGLELGFCTAVFFVTVQVHHFLVDGVIWKIRREPAGSPLFQHFAEKHHGELV